MGKLLRFRAVELPQPRLTENLSQRLLYPLRSKGDGKTLELFVIHSHDREIQLIQILTLKMGEIRFGKGLGQLDLPLSPAAAEHHVVAVFDLAHRLTLLIHEDHRLQGVIGLPLGIGFLHRPGQCLASVKAFVKHTVFLLQRSGGKISSSCEKCVINRSGRFSSVTVCGFLPGYCTATVMPRPAALAPTISRFRLSPT